MSSVREDPPPRPWYREPLVWMIIAIPFSAVVMGVLTLVLAIRSDDGLVADDYYRQGLEINRVLERDKAALRMGLGASVRIDAAAISLRLREPRAAQGPDALVLRLAHPTRAGFDHAVKLRRVGRFSYAAAGVSLPPGRWYVQLEAPGWRLVGRLPVPGPGELELGPHPQVGRTVGARVLKPAGG